MKTTFGTSHFTSFSDACDYYRNYDLTSHEVDQKVKDGEISIGPPPLKEGQTLSVIRGEGRYQITGYTRFALTKINEHGLRVLAHANQARNHFDTREKAQASLDAFKAATGTHSWVHGDNSNLRIDEVDCFENGDAINAVFHS